MYTIVLVLIMQISVYNQKDKAADYSAFGPIAEDLTRISSIPIETKTTLVPILLKRVAPYIIPVHKDGAVFAAFQSSTPTHIIRNGKPTIVASNHIIKVSSLRYGKVELDISRDQLVELAAYIKHQKQFRELQQTLVELKYRAPTKIHRDRVLRDTTSLIKVSIAAPIISALQRVYMWSMLPRRLPFLQDIVVSKMWNAYTSQVLGTKYDLRIIEDRNERIIETITMNTAQITAMAKLSKLNSAAHFKFSKSYDALTKHEKQVVNKSITAQSTCKHTKLIAGLPETLDELAELVPPPVDLTKAATKRELLVCNACNQPALCPHYYFQYNENKNKGNKNKTSKTASSSSKNTDALIRQFADTTRIHNVYYCKICGESLVEIFDEVESFEARGIHRGDNGFSKKIWLTSTIIIARNIISTIDFDKGQLARSIANVVSLHIDDSTFTDKLITPEITADITTLYISIYVYVVLAHIISSSKTISFKSSYSKNSRPTGRSRNDIKSLLQTVARMIMLDNKDIINNIPHITNASIKAIIIKAFREIRGITIFAEQRHDVVDITKMPFYYYMLKVARIRSSGKRKLSIKDVTGIAKPNMSNLKQLVVASKNPRYVHFMNSVKADIYLKPDHKAIAIHAKIANKFHAEDHNHILKPPKPTISTPESFVYKVPKLSTIYCFDGKKHKYNILVFKHGEVTQKKYFAELMAERINESTPLLDSRCSICNTLKSEETKHPDDKIKIAITRTIDIAIFYDAIEHYCPVAKIHTWGNGTNGTKCTSCGLTKLMIHNKDPEYFDKYKSVPNPILSVDKPTKVKASKVSKPPTVKPITKSIIVKPEQVAVVAKHLLAVTKVPNEFFQFLGTMNVRTLHDITNNSEELAKEIDEVSKAAYLSNYTTFVLAEYARIKNETSEFAIKQSTIDFSKYPTVSDIYSKPVGTSGTAIELSLYQTLLNIANINTGAVKIAAYLLKLIIESDKRGAYIPAKHLEYSAPIVVVESVVETDEVNHNPFGDDDPELMDNLSIVDDD